MREIKSAARIARQIQQTETAMDKTILQANALVTAMIEARFEGRFAAEVGQGALDNVVRGLRSLTDARGAIASGHGELAKLAEGLAIAWETDGPLEEKTGPLLSVEPKVQTAA